MQKLNSEDDHISEQEDVSSNGRPKKEIVFEDVDDVLIKAGGFSKF